MTGANLTVAALQPFYIPDGETAPRPTTGDGMAEARNNWPP